MMAVNPILKVKIAQLSLPRFVGDVSSEASIRADRLRYRFGISDSEQFEKSVQAKGADIMKFILNGGEDSNRSALVELKRSLDLLSEDAKTRIKAHLLEQNPKADLS